MGKRKRGKRPENQSRREVDDDVVADADPDSENFFYDEIDKFHANNEKILLKEKDSDDDAESESEEEVLGLASDDEDSDSEQDASEDSEAQENQGIISGKAWGRKKSTFYGADTLDGLEGSDREEAEREEEEEVLAIQKRLAEQMDEDDYGLELLQAPKMLEKPEKDDLKLHIPADFSALSRKVQWKLARKQSPELEGLIQDFKAKITELENELSPLMKMVKSGKIPSGYGSDYINLKYRAYLAYVLNISFYLVLKTSKTPIQNHPVVSRLVQYRTVINQLAPIDKKLRTEIIELLRTQSGSNDTKQQNPIDTIESYLNTSHDGWDSDSSAEAKKMPAPKKISKRLEACEESLKETELNQFSKSMSERLLEGETNAKQKPQEDEGDDADDDRRAINYEIAKNKGIKQKRRKIDRNPRVKMKHKYRKAKIRRRGQVREYKPEIHKYSGEASGIRIGLKKSVTLQ